MDWIVLRFGIADLVRWCLFCEYGGAVCVGVVFFLRHFRFMRNGILSWRSVRLIVGQCDAVSAIDAFYADMHNVSFGLYAHTRGAVRCR